MYLWLSVLVMIFASPLAAASWQCDIKNGEIEPVINDRGVIELSPTPQKGTAAYMRFAPERKRLYEFSGALQGRELKGKGASLVVRLYSVNDGKWDLIENRVLGQVRADGDWQAFRETVNIPVKTDLCIFGISVGAGSGKVFARDLECKIAEIKYTDMRSGELKQQLASFSNDESNGALLLDTGFDRPDEVNRKYPKGYSVEKSAGRNGGYALRIHRDDPEEYKVFGLPVAMKQGKYYRLQFYARAENLKNNSASDGARIAGVEHRRDGKWVSGSYFKLAPPGTEWTKYDIVIPMTVPDRKFSSTQDIIFYLWRKWTGTLWIDDVTLSEAGAFHGAAITRPNNLSFKNGDGSFIISCNQDAPAELAAYLTLYHDGKIRDMLTKADEHKVIRGDWGALKPGPARLEIQLLDMKNKKVLRRQDFEMQAVEETPPANAAVIDRHGRLIVDGKPFMPIGVFSTMYEIDMQRVAEAGFNSIQNYNNLGMKMGKGTKSQRQNIMAVLDHLQKLNLKFVFTVNMFMPNARGGTFDRVSGHLEPAAKLVAAVREHPALLAWYNADEQPLSEVDNMVKLRETVSRIDPWHPVWNVAYESSHYPYYASTSDIVGYDHYPFRRVDEQVDLREGIKHVRRMAAAGLPQWGVPQIFSWGAAGRAKTLEELRLWRTPTLENMKTGALVFAAGGARGFFFFSYFTIFRDQLKLDPDLDKALAQWEDVKKVVSMLKELEPFIMSIEAPPEIEFPDNVLARSFRSADGKVCVVIVPLDESEIKARIRVKTPGQLQSKYGRTVFHGNGEYEFSTNALESDILISR